MDICVMCGETVPEGREICRGCELSNPKELTKKFAKKTDIITIPGDLPDLNEIIEASKSHWGNYSSMKKTNTQIVAYCTRQATKRTYGKVDIDITWYCKNKRKDKDNITGGGTKFILDGLVQAGTIKNDGWAQIGDINHKFRVDKHDPRIEIKVTEVAG